VKGLRLRLIPSVSGAWPEGTALASGSKKKAAWMATAEVVWTQLATRIPKELHRRLKLYCVTRDIAVMHFVVEAIEEKLGRKRGAQARHE